MIKISLKGLAKYMTSGPANQRKILHDYKLIEAQVKKLISQINVDLNL